MKKSFALLVSLALTSAHAVSFDQLNYMANDIVSTMKNGAQQQQPTQQKPKQKNQAERKKEEEGPEGLVKVFGFVYTQYGLYESGCSDIRGMGNVKKYSKKVMDQAIDRFGKPEYDIDKMKDEAWTLGQKMMRNEDNAFSYSAYQLIGGFPEYKQEEFCRQMEEKIKEIFHIMGMMMQSSMPPAKKKRDF